VLVIDVGNIVYIYFQVSNKNMNLIYLL